jgi:hypothetical protein
MAEIQFLDERENNELTLSHLQLSDSLADDSVQQPRESPRLPKEVRAIIYKYIGGPARYIKIDLSPSLDYYLTSPATGIPKQFSIESWSRTLATKEYVQLLGPTKHQDGPVFFRPEVDTVRLPSKLIFTPSGFFSDYISDEAPRRALGFLSHGIINKIRYSEITFDLEELEYIVDKHEKDQEREGREDKTLGDTRFVGEALRELTVKPIFPYNEIQKITWIFDMPAKLIWEFVIQAFEFFVLQSHRRAVLWGDQEEDGGCEPRKILFDWQEVRDMDIPEHEEFSPYVTVSGSLLGKLKALVDGN